MGLVANQLLPLGTPQPISIAPMDILYQYKSRSFVLWQGGGVRINGGEVTFTSCNIYSNTAEYVRAPTPTPKICPSPQWKNFLQISLIALCYNLIGWRRLH